MSKITHDSLTQGSGTGCFIAEPISVGVKGLSLHPT